MSIQYIADLTIEFDNGSVGAKTFFSASKFIANDYANNFLREVIQYAKDTGKNQVKSHRISVKQYTD